MNLLSKAPSKFFLVLIMRKTDIGSGSVAEPACESEEPERSRSKSWLAGWFEPTAFFLETFLSWLRPLRLI